MKNGKKLLILALTFVHVSISFAQKIASFNADTLLLINIDSPIVINSTPLTTESFIKEIIRDTSFYQAFRNMNKHSFVAENLILTYDKNNRLNSKIFRQIFHNNHGPYKIEYLGKVDSGKVYKRNGKYALYTVEMFDYIFTNPYNTDFIFPSSLDKKNNTNESYKEKLKTLVFNPGRPIKGLPFIGKKTEIFNVNMRQYYDYFFYKGTHLDSIPIYKFTTKVKEDLSVWRQGELIIKEVTTIFDRRNFQILGRYITMKYNSWLFSFDVKMNIELGYFNNNRTVLPTIMTYKGHWDIPFKKEEIASFWVIHKNYQPKKN